MLRGSAEAKIDDKGRLKVPSNFRRYVEETWGRDVFITSVDGDHGVLYPLPVWEAFEGRLMSLPSTNVQRQRYLERVGYFGQQAQLDAQGRMVVPARLRESAAIDGDIVLLGLGDRIAIWNRERFERRIMDRPFTDDDFQALNAQGV
ncbi:MAG TPA: division/cell wall cluster transcriptional repressor MraZ [Thermoanaerobaculia bacterium]|nr:division/cell wall cluster transcriptional repressor MraZ [Thermoanaerobaculia bacterium]